MTKKVIPFRVSAAALLLLPALTLGAAQNSSTEQHDTDSSAAANAERNTRNEAASSDAKNVKSDEAIVQAVKRELENALEGGAYKVVNRLDVNYSQSG